MPGTFPLEPPCHFAGQGCLEHGCCQAEPLFGTCLHICINTTYPQIYIQSHIQTIAKVSSVRIYDHTHILYIYIYGQVDKYDMLATGTYTCISVYIYIYISIYINIYIYIHDVHISIYIRYIYIYYNMYIHILYHMYTQTQPYKNRHTTMNTGSGHGIYIYIYIITRPWQTLPYLVYQIWA